MIVPSRRRTTTISACFALIGLTMSAVVFIAAAAATRERPAEVGVTPIRALDENQSEVKLLAYNVRRCQKQRSCLDEIAALIRRENPDIVLLSEILYECDTCEISNQVAYLAWAADIHAYAFGENYRSALSGLHYQERAGNAILSQFPLRNVRVQSFDTSIFKPRRNRRALWAEIDIAGSSLLLASLHNVSSNPPANLRQMQQILAVATRPAILGGDFNAHPDSAPIRLLLDDGKFAGDIQGGATFPSHAPERRLDYIFAPNDWKLTEHRVIEVGTSDHLPIVSTFAVPQMQTFSTYD